MPITYDEMMKNDKKIEAEKELLGGDIYRKRNFLPKIIINSENHTQAVSDFVMLEKIGNQFGADISLLYADLFIIYGMDKDESFETHINSSIREIAVTMGAKINLARKQALELKEKLTDTKCLELEGEDYCFIVIMLQELFMIYTALINFLYIKSYMDKSYLDAINERIQFLICKEYEDLRQKFNVVQCYAIASDNLLKTVH